MINAIPKFLYITNVKTDIHGGTMIGIGGFGQVYSGEYKRKQVALKVVNRGHNDVSSSSILFPKMLIYLVRIHLKGIFAGKP